MPGVESLFDLIKGGRHTGVESLFDLLKAGHEGLEAVQEQVTRDGTSFTETYYRKPGAAATTEGSRSQGKETEPPEKETARLTQQFDGRLPPTMSTQEHVQLAQQLLAQHKASLSAAVNKLHALVPAREGARVSGRVKDISSALGKLVRKPKEYSDASRLQDCTGMRCVVNNAAEQMALVDRIKQNFQVVGEDDYVSNPKGLYRAYHLTIRDSDGLDKEVQVQTTAQSQMQNFIHDIYKPRTPEQEEALSRQAEPINQYAQQALDYTVAADSGLQAAKPICPPIVQQLFHCL